MSQPTILHRGDPVDPPAGVRYPLVLRPLTALNGLFGLVTAFAGFVFVVPLMTEAVLRIGFLLRGGVDFEQYRATAMRYELPEGLLAGHLGIAMLTVVVLLVVWYLHGRRPKWIFSVQPGIRWRYLLAALLVAFVILNAMLWISFLWDGMPSFNSGQLYAASFVVIVVLAAPFQALGEEVLFRGYLMQGIGSMTGRAWIGIVGSALVFAFLHGTQSPALFAHRFAFGLVAGWLVVATGGLEAAVAAHVVNNLGAFGYAIFTTSVAEVRAVQEITWAKAAWDILAFALFALVARWIGRRMQVAEVTP